MTIADDANRLLSQLQAGLNAEDAFLALFAFIDSTPSGRFRWFTLGEGAVFGVECDLEIRQWWDTLRDSINEHSPALDLMALADLGDTLGAIIANGDITPSDSKNLVIALRTLDAAFVGVHAADALIDNDLPGLVRLRQNLWQGRPLFSHGELRVYPKPSRHAAPERRGQSRLTELLNVLTVVRDNEHLQVDVRLATSIAKIGQEGVRLIGIIPAIQHVSELRWAREPNCRYSIAEHEDTDVVHTRIRAALDALIARGAQVIVMPELVSGEALIRMLKDYLFERSRQGLTTPAFLLAGTYMTTDAHDGLRRNRAIVLDGEGNEVWRQDKMHAYRFSASDQTQTGHPLGQDDLADRDEDICLEPRNLVVVDVAPSQRLVVLTCEDFLQDDPHRLVIADLSVTTLLVPIMAPTRQQPPSQGWVRDAAMNYVRHPGATIVVANSGTLLMSAESRNQWWQLGDVLSSPRIAPHWEPLPGPAGQPPVAWLVQLDRAV